MTEREQKDKMYDLFNKEQGAFTYYTCGLLVAMIGYSFKMLTETDKSYLLLPIIGILAMFVSLGFGIYFLNYRVSNYYNNANLLDRREKTSKEWEKESCKNQIDKNGNSQALWCNLHLCSLAVGPIIMFIWLIVTIS